MEFICGWYKKKKKSKKKYCTFSPLFLYILKELYQVLERNLINILGKAFLLKLLVSFTRKAHKCM